MKNKIFTILIAVMLISPCVVEGSIFQEDIKSNIISDENSLDTVDNSIDTMDKITYKQPVSKRKIAKKFLLAMSGVGISSILLFLILSLYNRIRSNILKNNKDSYLIENTSLTSPDNLNDAIKIFLDKTKWS